MAIRSMTGFGSADASHDGSLFHVEITAVNRRQLSVQTNLPKTLSALEPALTADISRNLSRGQINVFVSVEWSEAARRRGIHIDVPLAQTYLQNLRAAARHLDLRDSLDASLLLSLPDVVRYDGPRQDPNDAWPPLRQAARSAMRNLLSMKRREGKEIETDLLRRIEAIESLLKRIEKRAPRAARARLQKLRRRLLSCPMPAADATENIQPNPIAAEEALLAERADVSEEIARIHSHIGQARRFLASSRPVGRDLDFLCQELLREINTIASKAADLLIAQCAVRFKADLERFREQVQNVE